MKTKLKVLSEINVKHQEIKKCLPEHLSTLNEELKQLEEELTKYRK
jgi:hypothetical protein